ncbi:hypothetical protein, partial [Akkermansia sp.]|uniref:hypothetical protein n=1 Tax=Akkermansia sp. TaxID=1872421 RepID=UPI003AB2BA01
ALRELYVVRVKTCSPDPVDSSEMAFIMAAKLAYKAAMPEAGPVILEPAMAHSPGIGPNGIPRKSISSHVLYFSISKWDDAQNPQAEKLKRSLLTWI